MKTTIEGIRQRSDEFANPEDQALGSAATRLATTIQSAGDGVIVTDVEGRVEFLNLAAERITGTQSAEVAGQPLHVVLQLEERYGGPVKGDLVELAILSETTIALGKDLLLVSHDGKTTQVEGEISARIRSGSVTGAVVTFRDVTARNWDELQRREQEKMRLVGQLAGAIAHELNNLLTVIMGHSETLDNLYSELPPLRASTAAIQWATNGMAAVTRQLLTLSGRQVLQPTTVNLNTLLERSTPKLRSLVPAEIELVITLEPSLGAVFVDSTHMEQALFDLVRYSCDRMPTGGKLELSTANVATDVNCRSRHVRHYVQLTIADSGLSLKGIGTEELLQPSWNPDPGKPTGFGLLTVRGVVGAAKGHFSVESESGQGAKFVLLFPHLEEASVTLSRPVEIETVAQPTILLVEDDHAIRILLRNSFEQKGYRVIEARDGAEAILQAELHEKTIHLVITDVVMPIMDGPALARSLAITRPDIKVLLISGCPDKLADVQQLLQRGAHFLQKPFSQRELIARVEAILSDRQV
jgi:two-component system, cell cycle sensor histidine kinase and response regulator CckA